MGDRDKQRTAVHKFPDLYLIHSYLGMATGGFGTGHPYPILVPKYLVISQTRDGVGRGIPIPIIELKLNPILGSSWPGYVLLGRGGAEATHHQKYWRYQLKPW